MSDINQLVYLVLTEDDKGIDTDSLKTGAKKLGGQLWDSAKEAGSTIKKTAEDFAHANPFTAGVVSGAGGLAALYHAVKKGKELKDKYQGQRYG